MDNVYFIMSLTGDLTFKANNSIFYFIFLQGLLSDKTLENKRYFNKSAIFRMTFFFIFCHVLVLQFMRTEYYDCRAFPMGESYIESRGLKELYFENSTFSIPTEALIDFETDLVHFKSCDISSIDAGAFSDFQTDHVTFRFEETSIDTLAEDAFGFVSELTLEFDGVQIENLEAPFRLVDTLDVVFKDSEIGTMFPDFGLSPTNVLSFEWDSVVLSDSLPVGLFPTNMGHLSVQNSHFQSIDCEAFPLVFNPETIIWENNVATQCDCRLQYMFQTNSSIPDEVYTGTLCETEDRDPEPLSEFQETEGQDLPCDGVEAVPGCPHFPTGDSDESDDTDTASQTAVEPLLLVIVCITVKLLET